MGFVNIPRLFDIAALKDKTLVQNLLPLVDFLNSMTDEIVSNINGQLEFGANVKAELRTVTLTHNKETIVSFKVVKSTKVLVVDVSDFDAVLSLRRKITSKGELLLKPTFSDASTESRSVTLFLIP